MSSVTGNSRVRPSGQFRPEWLSPRQFWDAELEGKRTRPSRGWIKRRCPFHQSKSGTSFSANIASGAWHCFGCDLRGDLIRFVRLRYNLGFVAAARYLNAWDGDVTREHVATINAARLQHQREQEAKAAKIAEARGRRLQARGWLHALEAHYRRESMRLSEMHGADSAAAEVAWSNLAMLHVEIAEAEATYFELSGLGHGR